MTNKEFKRQIFLQACENYKEKRIQMVFARTSAYSRTQLEKMTDKQIGLIIASYSLDEE